MTTRPDLSALTDDALAVIANRGLVKRAHRMQTTDPLELTVSEHAVVARYSDGVETSLDLDSELMDASCTCQASGMCRHSVGLVLAYRQQHPKDEDAPWSPGDIDDEALASHLGLTAIRRAEKVRRAGYSATIHRPVGADPTVRVELPHCTVRFLVPHELGLAHSSASDEVTPESVALAVWAVREADVRQSDIVHVGGSPRPPTMAAGPASILARTVLFDGVANVTAVQRADMRRSVRSMQAGTAVWLTDACVDLVDQVEGYCARHAAHSRIRSATVIAEIDARLRIGQSADASTAAAALGTDTPGETPLRRTRLIALGAHVTGAGSDIRADVYFGEPGSEAVHVMRHEWTGPAGDIPTGHDAAKRRVAGTTVRHLASSTIVTESAVRQANHRIRFGRRGIGRTSILPLSADAWKRSLKVATDYAVEATRLADRGPSFASERVLTRGVGLIRVDTVLSKEYSPESQRLTINIRDGQGNPARVVVEHRSYAPRAIDAVDDSLSAGPATIAGRLSIRGGLLQITPFAISARQEVVVPDLEATVSTTTSLQSRTAPPSNAVDNALEVLSNLSHRGLRHTSVADATHLQRAATQLDDCGMGRSAFALTKVADAIPGAVVDLADAWIHAVLRLTVAQEI